jgi:hypothetical protein
MKFYPRLFENPNALYMPDIEKIVEWSESKTFPFSYYNGELYLGKWGDTHLNIKTPQDYKGDTRGQYSGRIFADYKIIAFWHFPEDQKTLKKVLDDLRKKIYADENDSYEKDHYKYDFYDGEWMIEVPSEVEEYKKYPTTKEYDFFPYPMPNWGTWRPEEENQEYVKVKDYEKGTERSAEELAQQHVVSPLLKPKRKVLPGWGSNSDRYRRKRQWQMASMTDESKQEMLYPRLFEHPDWVTINLGKDPATGEEKRTTYEWHIDGTFPFGYYRNKFYMGEPKETHGSIVFKRKNGNFSPGREMKFAGRIWLEQKLISFWDYPSKEELPKVLKDIEKTLHIKIIGTKRWKIDVPENMEDLEGGRYYGNVRYKQIPIDEYIGKYKTAEEDLARQHVLSPLLKPKKKVEAGWGSKNPRYTANRKWAMASMTDESKQEMPYPRLFEHPDWVNPQGTDEEILWMRRGTRAFGYHKGKLYISKPSKTHGDIGIGRGYNRIHPGRDLEYAGRIWLKEKYISFWYYPPKEKLIQIIKDLEDKLKISILNDPQWKIDIPADMKDDKQGGMGGYGSHYLQIPIKDYAGEYITSEDDLARQHVLSPLLKPKKKVEPGWGSNSERYRRKRQWQMAIVGDESVQEPHYPRLFEGFNKRQELWKNLYVKDMNSDDIVAPSGRETIRANFGENDGTAEKNIINFLKNSIKIEPRTYQMEIVPKGKNDKHAGKEISGKFDAYKIVFSEPTTDVFGQQYKKDDFIIITNRFEFDKKAGEESVIKGKELTPDKLGLTTESYLNSKQILDKIIKVINETKYPEHYKKFIIESSKIIINDPNNKNKFEDFSAYAKVTTPIVYNVPIEWFNGIDPKSINNIANDYGEVMGALMFFNILKKTGKGLRYPTASNQRLIDFYFDDYKISSKAGTGATPSGDVIIRAIYNNYKNGEITATDENEIDFIENVVKPWVNPEQIDPRSVIYNTVMTLAKIHLSNNPDSAYSYLLRNLQISSDEYLKKESMLKFLDALIHNKEKYELFINEYIRRSQMSRTQFNPEKYRQQYIKKLEIGNDSRFGLIFYPIMVEIVKTLNGKYADILTTYTQKVINIKQVYLKVYVKRGQFAFETHSFQNSNFMFEQKGSINVPFIANIGIKMVKR